MFHPSPSLLFRPMAVLNKIQIHHPFPLTPQESQQLLNLLTSSFRHHLDSEHPPFRQQEHVSGSSKSNSKLRRRSLSDHEGHHTDRHMHSLLTNPLFNPAPGVRTFARSTRDPMDVFDLAVGKGMMNFNYAKACLSAKKKQIVLSPVLSIRDGMKQSGAGMKVLKWLVSSGTANDNRFLLDQGFAELLMEYLVAEGLQEPAWKWIKRSFDGLPALSLLTNDAYKHARHEVAGPLRALVKAESVPGISYDAAYMCMSRAASYLKGVPAVTMTEALQPAGLVLLNRTCMPVVQFSHPPPTESCFESFISLVPVICPTSADLHLAHLSLLHPTTPNPELALDYLRRFDSLKDRKETLVTKPNIRGRRHLIQLGLDTAKYLLEYDRHSEMEWVMNFLSTNFPRQLGIDQERQLEQVKAEASSMEMLASIGIA